MPQLIGLAILGAGAIAGVRLIKGLMSAVQPQRAEAPVRSSAQSAMKDLGHLEYDPATGTYRPRRP
jgi:hypothetical protein